MISKNSQLGFTLIELIVTTVIVIMLTGAGIAAYNTFNQNQIIKQAAADLKNNIRLVQSKALNGEKLCGSEACGGVNATCGDESDDETALSGWQIKFYANSYEISGLCGDTAFSKKTYPLPSASASQQVSFSPIPPNLLFVPMSGTVTNPGTICLLGFSKKYKLSITASGEVKDYGLVSSCQ